MLDQRNAGQHPCARRSVCTKGGIDESPRDASARVNGSRSGRCMPTGNNRAPGSLIALSRSLISHRKGDSLQPCHNRGRLVPPAVVFLCHPPPRAGANRRCGSGVAAAISTATKPGSYCGSDRTASGRTASGRTASGRTASGRTASAPSPCARGALRRPVWHRRWK